MIVKVDIGGVWVSFGLPGTTGPSPFYPYLLVADPVQEATSDTAATTSCALFLKAQELIGLDVQRPIAFINDSGEEVFSGLISRIEYENTIIITAEA